MLSAWRRGASRPRRRRRRASYCLPAAAISARAEGWRRQLAVRRPTAARRARSRPGFFANASVSIFRYPPGQPGGDIWSSGLLPRPRSRTWSGSLRAQPARGRPPSLPRRHRRTPIRPTQPAAEVVVPYSLFESPPGLAWISRLTFVPDLFLRAGPGITEDDMSGRSNRRGCSRPLGRPAARSSQPGG